ncbi:MAG TPA: class I SAM-dependent methyltransferase [Candidatus Limnocylindrales bacterium]|nr:class I SAM-dependent methyltransferase [Candidatus Limnocylindrales bacterium]
MKSRIQFVEVPIAPIKRASTLSRMLQHPVFAWAGMRPPIAQHTLAEHEALMRRARVARTIVEIGVAEGASAAGLREAMPGDGTLFLIDPFHLSRIPPLNFLKRAARRAVDTAGSARTVWIESLSQDAVHDWKVPVDFLLIDGDHHEQAVERDWTDWSRFVKADGVVAFHDGRVFPSGWPTSDYGPVRFIDRVFRQGSNNAGWSIVEEVDSLVFVARRQRS